jgi:hypothetical protein
MVRIITSERTGLRGRGNIADMKETRNAYRILHSVGIYGKIILKRIL